MRGKRLTRRQGSRRGTTSSDEERTYQMSEEEFYRLSAEKLLELGDKIGVGLQGAPSLEQARARLLNDAIFLP